MRVAVVILNWNGKSFLKKFLQTVIQNSPESTIYVADNASTDGSIEYVIANHPNVKIIDNQKNYGYAGGYNKALASLEEEFLVLLNSDVEVTQGWLQPMIQLLDSDDKIAACQPKMLSHSQNSHFEYAGAAGGFIDTLGYPFCRGRMFDTLEKDTGQYNSPIEVFWATGACLFVRNSVFIELDGLDEDFFAHMEEIDFCWRTKRAGYKIMVQPNSIVYHVGGGTLSSSNPLKTFLNFRNGLEMLVKNLPMSRLLPVLIARMLLDGVAAFKFLLSGQPKDFWAVFKGHIAFYGRIRKTLSKRIGGFGPIDCRFKGSIVFAYFLGGKKTFRELPPSKF
jgi:hypothetical protein